MYPFTIRKESNIFGLIFGSKHPLGVNKFLDIAWKQNAFNGEANFDIAGEMDARQGNLFGDKTLTKIEKFEKELKNLILSKKEIGNDEIYTFTIEKGHIPRHAVDCLKEMRKNKEVEHFSYPKISYDSIYKDKTIIKFKVKILIACYKH